MKVSFLLVLLFASVGSQAGCLESWQQALEVNLQKLNPVDRRVEDVKPEGIIGVVTDQFIEVGESVIHILEKSTLVPRVRFQERVIRILTSTETTADVESLRMGFVRRHEGISKQVFQKKIEFFKDRPELFCLSAEELQKLRSLPLVPASYVLTEAEFFVRLKKAP